MRIGSKRIRKKRSDVVHEDEVISLLNEGNKIESILEFINLNL